MADTKQPFVLTRATPEDMPEITQLCHDSFGDFARRAFMGVYSPDDLPKLTAHFIDDMKNDPSDIWIKVTDVQTGKIIAASNWKVYASTAIPHGLDVVMPWLTDEEAIKLSESVIAPMNETRLKAMAGQPYIHLHICFSAAEHRRRGAGGMMMQWGCDLADLLSLPGWIEASPEGMDIVRLDCRSMTDEEAGNFLYQRFGFYDFQEMRHEDEPKGMAMKREPRKEIYGGKS